MPRRRQQLLWRPTTNLFFPNITVRRYYNGTPPTPPTTPTEPDSELTPSPVDSEPELEPEGNQFPPKPDPLFSINLHNHLTSQLETDISVFTHTTPYINTRYYYILEALRPLQLFRAAKLEPTSLILSFLAEPITISLQHLLAIPVGDRPRKLFYWPDTEVPLHIDTDNPNPYQPHIPLDYKAGRKFWPQTVEERINNVYYYHIVTHNNLYSPVPPEENLPTIDEIINRNLPPIH